MATKEELQIVRRLMERGEIKVRGKLPYPKKPRALSRLDVRRISEALETHTQIVIVRHPENGKKRTRGVQIYSVSQYRTLSEKMKNAWRNRKNKYGKSGNKN
jgi:hypothetical protein